MLTIDGSMGEGGGQVLRSALSLSLCTDQACRIVNIRARRAPPGLRPQHLAAVNAAAAISHAHVEGATIGSRALTFAPERVTGGRYRFAIGTAGSAALVLQTVLPVLLAVRQPSEIEIEGGTHNPRAPTYDFLARTYAPLLERMGPRIALALVRHGFEPSGGGLLRASITPVERLAPLALERRGELRALSAEVLISRLPGHIAAREAAVLAALLHLGPRATTIRAVTDSRGPGNVVTVFAETEALTETIVEFGRPGIPAERVAENAAQAALEYLASGVPVGPHLADQLLLPLALAGGGIFTTVPPTAHTLTNARVIEQFLPIAIRATPHDGSKHWRIALTSIAARDGTGLDTADS